MSKCLNLFLVFSLSHATLTANPMKKLILMLFVVPLIQGCNQQPAARYQVIDGTYDEDVRTDFPSSEDHGLQVSGWTAQKHAIFKIDSQTGRTWIYVDVNYLTTNSTNPGYDGWRELKDLPPK